MAYNVTAAVKTPNPVQSSQTAKRTSAKSKKSGADDKDSFGKALKSASEDAASASAANNAKSAADDRTASVEEPESGVQEMTEAVPQTAQTVVVWTLDQQGMQMQGAQQAFSGDGTAVDTQQGLPQGILAGEAAEAMPTAQEALPGGAQQEALSGGEEAQGTQEALAMEMPGHASQAAQEDPRVISRRGDDPEGAFAAEEADPGAAGERRVADTSANEQPAFGEGQGEKGTTVSVKNTQSAGQGAEEAQTADTGVEAFADGRDIHAADAQGADAAADAQPHVSQTGEMREEYADMLKDLIARQISDGKQELEISLSPRELGTLIVKVAYEAGETSISILCTNSKAMHAMSQKAGELGQILEESLGSKMEVVVETEQKDPYFNQDGRSGSGAEAQQERQEEKAAEHRRFQEQAESGADFLHQLRLGLTE